MNQPMIDTVLTNLTDDVYTITLNRPHVMNAMDMSMFTGLSEAISQAAHDQTIRVVVLRGAGGHFCSGADLNALKKMSDPREVDSLLVMINGFLSQLAAIDKPTVAVLEGAAVGAGLNLALHADFVIAREDALLQEPFVQIGLTTDFGGTYLLPRLVGMPQAKRLALLGERLTGAEAERIGLIYKAVPEAGLQQAFEQLIGVLRRLPRKAYAVTKDGFAKGLTASLADMLVWEKEQQPRLIASPEFQELIAAKTKRG
ncbi:enoyl-CoA hydratase-related protein [Brevibacillus humidisoli]|uniref:enoyl-CoA hydratase/isomerase family protein n=1 Tax=Brevibacillus humidisoli TaxID=2895522 RepID=UPI001E3383C3|nr:enoyl-CoA hydratase-related protein [Brevibacillus humidisoli]UFJ41977.1 enoyl-CoA hydratase-related protein [Brevibacillus humidisoli]